MSNIRLPFVKMEGLGNCYVFVEAARLRKPNLRRIAAKVSDISTGIGADGLIVFDTVKSPYRMRIFNHDGSEAEMCGNGLRQAALYLKRFKYPNKNNFEITSKAGVFPAEILSAKENRAQVKASLGKPVFGADSIGLTDHRKLAFGLKFKHRGKTFIADCVSMGNPHAVVIVDDFDFNWAEVGQAISVDGIFKHGINVHFLKIENSRKFQIRNFERGAGVTMACGSGAAACLAIAVMRGLTTKSATAVMLGGNLKLHWDFQLGQIIQTGPASIICQGEYFL
jgi:diaminopimelate epimerase